jgi:hypothetical protein
MLGLPGIAAPAAGLSGDAGSPPPLIELAVLPVATAWWRLRRSAARLAVGRRRRVRRGNGQARWPTIDGRGHGPVREAQARGPPAMRRGLPSVEAVLLGPDIGTRRL